MWQAEIIHTVIGSFGLVTVAPFTALCAGLFLARRGGHPQPRRRQMDDLPEPPALHGSVLLKCLPMLPGF